MELKTYFAQDAAGNTISSPTVYLYNYPSGELATGLQDSSGAALGNPFSGDTQGKIAFYAPDGHYTLRVVGSARDNSIRVDFVDNSKLDTAIAAADIAVDAADRAEAASGYRVSLAYATRAELVAVSGTYVGQSAAVFADSGTTSGVANEGVYSWSGSAWARIASLEDASNIFYNGEPLSNILDRYASAVFADGPVYVGYKQVVYAITDGNGDVALAVYLDGTRDDWTTPNTTPDGIFSDVTADTVTAESAAVSTLEIGEWAFAVDGGKAYVGYGEIVYAVTDVNGQVASAIFVDGSQYGITVEETDPVDPVDTLPDITCLGDSLTADIWPDILATLTGRTVRRIAIGGQTSRHIVGRAGCVTYRLTLSGNAIAVGSNPVTAINGAAIVGMNATTSTNVQFLSTGSDMTTRSAWGRLGSVYGTLTRSASSTSGSVPSTTETYTFTPDSGQTLPYNGLMPAETPFVVYSVGYDLDATTIIAYMGRNNYSNTAQVLSDFAAVYRRFGPDRLVFINPPNGDYVTERSTNSDNSGWQAFRTLENTLAELYPRNFLNLRRILVDQGLTILGITPTAQDLLDIAGDTVPASLRRDNVHATTATNTSIIAPAVKAYLELRGI